MRFSAAVLLFLTTGSAGASSLVLLESAKAGLGPSMVLADGEPSHPSRSVLTLAETVPAVSHEKLSAIGSQPERRPGKAPLLIKGGRTGQPAGRKE